MKGQKRLVVFLGVGALVLAGCSSTWHLTSSSLAPAATGKVVITAGPNNNTRLAISVRHLAPPQKMSQSGTTYVVWARGAGVTDRPQNLGALKLDSDLSGQLETVTPLREFDLTITVENTHVADSPTSNSVLSGHIVRN